MNSRARVLFALAALALGLVAGACGVLSRDAHVLSAVEQASVDALFRLRQPQESSSDVVVVALDTESFRHLPQPPLPRAMDARLVRRLTAAGASVIAFDFALERPSIDPAGDRALVRALEEARHAVVSVTAVTASGGTAPLAGVTQFAATPVRPGVTLLNLDGDGVIRRFPTNLGGIDSFALAAARSYSPAIPSKVPARALIDYPGTSGVQSISFLQVLSGEFPTDVFRGRIVVVGPTAPVLQDLHTTPLAGATPGPQIQAAAIETALEGYPLRYASGSSTTWLLLALGMLTVIALALAAGGLRLLRRSAHESLALSTGALGAVATGVLVEAAWLGAAHVAFNRGTVVDVADGSLTIVLATAGIWALTELRTARARRHLRELFAASDPETVAGVLQASRRSLAVLSAQDVIAGYRLKHQIGIGGMGVVYESEQLRLSRPVALKLLRPEYAESIIYRARFRRESELAASVNHPNIVVVLDAGEDDGLLYLVMQLIEGISLDGAIGAGNALAADVVAGLAVQLGAALDAVHAKGLVHRDVKPANVLLRAADPSHALLTDFGIAKADGTMDHLTSPDGWLGSPDYVAPEQLEDAHNVDRRADVYSLAGVLFHCLTGSVPFPRPTKLAKITAHLHAPRPLLSDYVPGTSEKLDALLARGMAVDPSERPASAGELAREIATALESEPPQTPPRPQRGDEPSPEDPTEASDGPATE